MAPMPTRLVPFAGALQQALKADANRPMRERRMARAPRAELKALGCDDLACGRSRLKSNAAGSISMWMPARATLGA